MRSLRSTTLALTPLLVILVTAQATFAQTPQPSASPSATAVAKGICAPWHRCLALGTMAITVLLILVLGVGYLVQRRGFDKIEHRQGNPEGIKAE
jgi:hypothetical protein